MAKSPAVTKSWGQAYREHRFAVLLVILSVLLTGAPLLLSLGFSARWFDGVLSLLTLISIVSLCFERHERICALVFGVPTLLLTGAGQLLTESGNRWIMVVGHVSGTVFLFGAAVLIVRSLFGHHTLTFDSILGAVCGYLFLGLGWAIVYSMIETVQPHSFEFNRSEFDLPHAPVGEPRRQSPDRLIYYSFVTLTTVGYGDIRPISPATRTLAWIEAISGQFYLAVIVAGLVSMMPSKSQRASPDN